MSDVENTEAVEVEQEEIEIPKSVKVGSREVTFVLPKSLSVRYDLIAFHSKNGQRALAAALGLCWGGLGKPKAKYEDSFNVGVYGGAVFDELIERGVSHAEIIQAGLFAFATICRALPQAQEVDRAEGN